MNDLSNRMAALESRFETLRNEVHQEIKLLTGKDVEIVNRLSRIEDRVGPR